MAAWLHTHRQLLLHCQPSAHHVNRHRQPPQVPPKSYYLYDFVASNGLRLFMSAAAQRGKVCVRPCVEGGG
jgi:hypothetical protein